MKKYHLFKLLSMAIMAVMSVGFVSCGDDDDPSELQVNPSSVVFEANGGSMIIAVSSNTSWSISGVPSWLQVSTMNGKNNQQVVLTASGNTTEDARTGILSIVTDDGDASSVVTLSQLGIKIDQNEVINTTWEDVHRYSDGSTYVESLQFSVTTARLSFTYTEGTSSTTNSIDYTFTRTNNIVVLTPVEAGKAVIEGKIESGAKMTLTNTSNGSEIAVLYKK